MGGTCNGRRKQNTPAMFPAVQASMLRLIVPSCYDAHHVARKYSLLRPCRGKLVHFKSSVDNRPTEGLITKTQKRSHGRRWHVREIYVDMRTNLRPKSSNYMCNKSQLRTQLFAISPHPVANRIHCYFEAAYRRSMLTSRRLAPPIQVQSAAPLRTSNSYNLPLH